MSWIGPAVHRSLIVECGRNDSTAATCLERSQFAAWRRSCVSPLVLRGQSDAAVTGVEHHKDVARRKPGDIAEPSIESQPAGRWLTARRCGINRDHISSLYRHITKLSCMCISVPCEEQDKTVFRRQ